MARKIATKSKSKASAKKTTRKVKPTTPRGMARRNLLSGGGPGSTGY